MSRDQGGASGLMVLRVDSHSCKSRRNGSNAARIIHQNPNSGTRGSQAQNYHEDFGIDGMGVITFYSVESSYQQCGESHYIIRGLSELLDGPHFSKIGVRCNAEDIDSRMITDLVSKCSETLETLYLGYYTLSVSFLASQLINFLPLRVDLDFVVPPPVDLSNASKLKYLEFRWRGPDIRWITTAIQTAQFKMLLQITIFLSSVRPISPNRIFLGWHELDHFMVQLWTSHSILPKILHWSGPQELMTSLLPELTKRGALLTYPSALATQNDMASSMDAS
ncbi:hypothetical protein BJ322DRAFT_1017860 [Thelephora terrestris]|uniref:Uncharacterized protein n=1 Tax=Thelephora terrestris TaxID=56493 RepID=A0A9P6HKD9_9AGAM|nr:hypothetical protein BJ322DRAFT_1017860 [Thelephora terrestris]